MGGTRYSYEKEMFLNCRGYQNFKYSFKKNARKIETLSQCVPFVIIASFSYLAPYPSKIYANPQWGKMHN